MPADKYYRTTKVVQMSSSKLFAVLLLVDLAIVLNLFKMIGGI